MKYIKAYGLEENEFYYFEVDAYMTAYRQVSITDDQYIVSIAPDFQLSDQEVEMFDGDEAISIELFNEVWEKAVAPYKATWVQVKQNYLPTDSVTGTIMMFYPQGVIIRLSHDVYAVADDIEFRRHTRPEHMYPGYRVHGTVKHYDDNNFWLVLENCKVTGEKMSV
ncbi:hypothetical protein BVG16_27685 [Paenibacillus selenitireducens]|uniref:S1 motif domain-containing protein n=1 Tax=Paenibacillus selenitireducens TaxID=1324314 RepID=A0A1T2X1A6_9BACL|nr:hypothetical protein [Paenibacillus selenitireducens]OPA73595.1 hypothetical protein BVG16_27685 [Paenibacillus selenitireducens]